LRIKICGNKTVEDIKAVVASGADAAGFLVGQLHASRDFILPSTAARLAGILPPYITPVLVTHLFESEAIMEIVLKTGITTVQLHGACTVDEVKKLKDLMPLNSKIIFSTYLSDNLFDPSPEDYYPFIDAVLLDCFNRTPVMIGITDDKASKIHDWGKSAEFVKKCPLPVVLAGGLSATNVNKAIQEVNPYGVDANTMLKDDNTECRSITKCGDFVRKARLATTPEIPARL
jgi:phosphoribosylanthranilate isomerase